MIIICDNVSSWAEESFTRNRHCRDAPYLLHNAFFKFAHMLRFYRNVQAYIVNH